MLSPHEIATLLLAAASLGPIDADALEPPDLAALEQARLVHVAVAEGQTKVIVTEDGHRVLRRLGLERPGGDRVEAPRLTMAGAQRAEAGTGTTGSVTGGQSAPTEAGLRAPVDQTASEMLDARETRAARELGGWPEWQQAASLPADASERREEQA